MIFPVLERSRCICSLQDLNLPIAISLLPDILFTLEKEDEIPKGKLFSWLASHFGITDSEAVIQFNEFIFDLTRKLKEGKEIHWQKVGSFQKEFTGEIQFTSVKEELPWLENVPGQKIIRDKR